MIRELHIRPGTEEPTGLAGWFLCWLHCSERPVVIYRSPASDAWRQGCTRVRVDAWAGPLPNRKPKGECDGF